MTDSMDVGDTHPLTSPWPLLVALGVALSELGVLFGVVPVAVGGILLFGGSVAGITRETGYVRMLWTPLTVLGVLFIVIGIGVWGISLPHWSLDIVLQSLETSRIALRGASIFTAGSLLAVVGAIGWGTASRTDS